MIYLHEYINNFQAEGGIKGELGNILDATRSTYDVTRGGDPTTALDSIVSQYNWMGDLDNKTKYGLKGTNLARNLPGALLQDFLLHLCLQLIREYPRLDAFTEVKVPFGRYPLWNQGVVKIKKPGEMSDIAIGYLTELEKMKVEGKTKKIEVESILINEDSNKEPIYKLQKNQSIWPLVTINSKIRISQSEFFDWQGREHLMTKGNPHCLSLQVALRKEMDLSIVEAAQAEDKFFLLGNGNERNVVPNHSALSELIEVLQEHLEDRMGLS